MPARRRPRAVASTESYTDYGKNPWIDASKDHLSTFAADVDTASLRDRAQEARRATRCRRRRACASRSGSTTSTTRSRAAAARRSRSSWMRRRIPFAARSLRAARRRRDAGRSRRRAQAVAPRVPRRRLGLDGRAEQAAAREAGAAHPHRQPDREGLGRARHVRRRHAPRAADDEHRRQGAHPSRDRCAERERLDRDGLGHRPRLRPGRRSGCAPARSRA